MRIASVTTEYPAPWNPHRGLFIQRRLAALSRIANVNVIHTTPWFPALRPWKAGQSPLVRDQGGLCVEHRKMFYLPGVLKGLDSRWVKRSVVTAIREVEREGPIDAIDAHFGYPEGVGCVRASIALGRPVFITMRGLERQILPLRWRGEQLRWALRNCTGIICVSESLKKLAVDVGVPPERIEMIPNAVDRRTFRPGDRDEARRVLGIEPEDRLIVCVGMLVAGKGQHHLVEALAGLRAKDARWKLVLLGGGAHEPGYPARLRSSIDELGVAGAVLLAGSQPPEKIATWLRAADVFALPTYDEGCCNAVLEAMACGLPVVTTPAGDNEFLVSPPHRGYIVPIGRHEELERALAAAVETAWDREAIAGFGAGYSWDEAARRTLHFFQERTGGRDRAIASERIPSGNHSKPR
ncbi:glycosyltransferase [Planctomyces sp. SH-PL62]|uniref:glycosyltransferase n=1 Tax=Planctomyces sp. SH-PL62 TaxID=1636152 RepID=UPI0009EF5704|nr:glycosyltransferase [Planctomyces sp. SH-PL62]